MTCPICQGNNITVKNGNFFCNHCNLYIGKKKANGLNDLPESYLPPANLKQPLSEIQQKEEKIIDVYGIFFSFLPSIVVLCVLSLIFLFVSSYPSYFSLTPYCKIKVESKATDRFNKVIYQSLDRLKNTDANSFNNLCSVVTDIKEENCAIFDAPLDKAAPGVNLSYVDTGGCFVRGSKIIYVSSLTVSNVKEVETTTKVLKKYAGVAKEYWNNPK